MAGGDATHGGRARSDIDADTVPFALGTPTGVGSLPHRDADEAVAWVLEALPELPAAPSTPQLDPREGMIGQGAWGIPGVTVDVDGGLVVSPEALEPDAPLTSVGIEGPPFATLRAFVAAVEGRTGPIKVQLTGPATLAAALIDAGAPPSLALPIATNAVRTRASDLLDAVALSAPAAPVLAVIDEPSMVGGPPPSVGPLEAVIDAISTALAVLEPRAITGIHCCGSADWKALLQAGPQLLSAPVDADFGPGSAALAAFLERGGWIAWGAVPTDGPIGDSAAHCWRELSARWCGLVRAGCDPVRIRRQALVTPACGLARHDLAQVDRVAEITRGLGLRIHDQLAGVRLSVGA